MRSALLRPVQTALASLTLALASPALGVVLYDGQTPSFPEAQGWLLYFPPGAAVADKSISGAKTVLNTGDPQTQVGWSNTVPLFNTFVNPQFPILDRSEGFSLGFDLRVASESHSSNDRAGFSVILLASDHQGIELGFWTNEIWAQTLSGTSFVHGEGKTNVDTTTMTHYDLGIQGSNYELYANGSLILSGSVRDYSSALSIPYGLNNYLFIGDNTTSATASIELSSLTIVPEPASGMALIGVMIISAARSRRGRLRRAIADRA